MRRTFLSLTNTVTQESSKRNFEHEFNIQGNWERLVIYFSYFPDEMKDNEEAVKIVKKAMPSYGVHGDDLSYGTAVDYLPLYNFLTLSVDTPVQYAGSAFRAVSHQRHIISPKSSDGFICTEIVKGKWNVTISVYRTVTQSCTYSLEVLGERECL